MASVTTTRPVELLPLILDAIYADEVEDDIVRDIDAIIVGFALMRDRARAAVGAREESRRAYLARDRAIRAAMKRKGLVLPDLASEDAVIDKHADLLIHVAGYPAQLLHIRAALKPLAMTNAERLYLLKNSMSLAAGSVRHGSCSAIEMAKMLVENTAPDALEKKMLANVPLLAKALEVRAAARKGHRAKKSKAPTAEDAERAEGDFFEAIGLNSSTETHKSDLRRLRAQKRVL